MFKTEHLGQMSQLSQMRNLGQMSAWLQVINLYHLFRCADLRIWFVPQIVFLACGVELAIRAFNEADICPRCCKCNTWDIFLFLS